MPARLVDDVAQRHLDELELAAHALELGRGERRQEVVLLGFRQARDPDRWDQDPLCAFGALPHPRRPSRRNPADGYLKLYLRRMASRRRETLSAVSPSNFGMYRRTGR